MHCSVIDEDFIKIDISMANFHCEKEIFQTDEIHSDGKCINAFLLSCQHTLSHFHHLIQEFGASNGFCSSITESKHIKAVKEPWQHSSQFEALAQMLLINKQLDKLAAAQVDFQVQEMLDSSIFSISHVEASTPDSINENNDGEAVELPGILTEVKLVCQICYHSSGR